MAECHVLRQYASISYVANKGPVMVTGLLNNLFTSTTYRSQAYRATEMIISYCTEHVCSYSVHMLAILLSAREYTSVSWFYGHFKLLLSIYLSMSLYCMFKLQFTPTSHSFVAATICY